MAHRLRGEPVAATGDNKSKTDAVCWSDTGQPRHSYLTERLNSLRAQLLNPLLQLDERRE